MQTFITLEHFLITVKSCKKRTDLLLAKFYLCFLSVPSYPFLIAQSSSTNYTHIVVHWSYRTFPLQNWNSVPWTTFTPTLHRAPDNPFLFLRVWLLLLSYVSGIVQYLSLVTGLFQLAYYSQGPFMFYHLTRFCSLRLNTISLYVYPTFATFIHQWIFRLLLPLGCCE